MATIVKLYSLGKLNTVFVAGVLVAALPGCASKQVKEENTATMQPASVEQKTDAKVAAMPAMLEHTWPEWVKKGNGAFQDAGNNVFYGVGIVSGVSNKALAISTVDDRARAEIGKILKTYVASLNKDYQASIGNGKNEETAEQNIQKVVKTFSSTTLNGAIIVDHWTDPADGTIYALAKLDMNSVKKSFPGMKGIAADAKEYYMQNADRAFAELAAEEQKAKDQGQQ